MKKLYSTLMLLSTFGLYLQANAIILDKRALEEFREAKKKIFEIGITLEGWDKNKLIALCHRLATLPDSQLAALLDSPGIQETAKQLSDKISNTPRYQAAYKQALSDRQNEEAWNNFRKTNGLLVGEELKKHGVKYPADLAQTTTKEYLALNNELDDQTVPYVIAGSVLLYAARQLQREKTGKECPPIVFR